MPKPLTLNEDFPTTDNLCKDAYSLSVISPAYASPSGELNAVLQYIYHSINFEKKGYKEYADTLKSIAIAEMLHLELLGETIYSLGSEPIYCQNPPTSFNFYSTKSVTYSRCLTDMLNDDILGEKKAIAQYTKILERLKNEQVKKIIARILKDERLHLETLCDILKNIGK